MIKILTKFTIIPILVWLFSSFCLCLWWENAELYEKFPWEDERVNKLECNDNTDLWNCTSVKEDKDWWDETIIRRLLWVFGLDTSKDKDKDLKFIDYARAILNMALGLIAFIALIMTIYTFYMMLFSENDAWIKKAKWNLVGIFIALGIIWLAWIVTSFIFWRYQSNWKDKEKEIQSWDIATVWEFYGESYE